MFPSSLGWLADAMAAVASETFTSTSAPMQYAAFSGLEDRPEMTTYLAHSRQILAALLGDEVVEAAALADLPVHAGRVFIENLQAIHAHVPPAGFQAAGENQR